MSGCAWWIAVAGPMSHPVGTVEATAIARGGRTTRWRRGVMRIVAGRIHSGGGAAHARGPDLGRRGVLDR